MSRRGRAEARFTDLMVEVGPELLNYFERRVRDGSDDLLSELMATAWRRNADLPTDHEQARMWLFGIARNLLRNGLRSNARRTRLENAVRDSIPSDSPDVAEQLAIRDAVQRLDPDLAEIVTLVHWEGLTIAEVGHLQGVPASTARGRYQRAREALKEALTEQQSPA